MLASAGFCYTGMSDMVRCTFSCADIFGSWRPGDQPRNRHKKLHPDCSFFKTTLVKNVDWCWDVNAFEDLMVEAISAHPQTDLHELLADQLNLRHIFQTWLESSANENKTRKEIAQHLMRLWRADNGFAATPAKMCAALQRMERVHNIVDMINQEFTKKKFRKQSHVINGREIQKRRKIHE